MKSNYSTDVTLDVRCKAFSCESAKVNRILVDISGSVLVWDAVAGHYTACHILSEVAQEKMRRLAKDSQYRFENGTLYELRGGAYWCCYKSFRAKTKQAAIREYESL
jgi:hypothetical protein